MTDAGRVRAGTRDLFWEIEGMENFCELAEMDGGAILMTAHMGNYDIAGPTFAGKFKRKLNTVRAPESDDGLQEFYQQKGDRQRSDNFAVNYNAPGGMLGVDLVKMLGRKEVVALQGDRVIGEVAPAAAEVCGKEIDLPEGPHFLALASRSPIFPLFVIRSGWRRYRIVALPPLPIPTRERGVPKAEIIGRSVDAWARVLTAVLHEHWDQWLEFGEVFNRGGDFK